MLKLILPHIYFHKNIQLHLYTTPTSSHSQQSKTYLNSQHITYTHKHLTQNFHLQQQIKKISPNPILPLFLFYKK
ncbi:thioredoxin domain-containing protein, partial [Staphylococcus saprophyticus]|uniref:hypothetical protein n=1 Tax=Staphylococcus saprophyticus TaxID=29385 RepID=UPI0028CB3310